MVAVAVVVGLIIAGPGDGTTSARPTSSNDTVRLGAGTTPGNGRYVLSGHTTPDGQHCMSITLFNQPTGSGKGNFGDCGQPGTDLGTITGHTETIIYGRVPLTAQTIKLRARGRDVRVVEAKRAPAPLPYRYFLTVYAGRLATATATVRGRDGSRIAVQRLALPGAGAPG